MSENRCRLRQDPSRGRKHRSGIRSEILTCVSFADRSPRENKAVYGSSIGVGGNIRRGFTAGISFLASETYNVITN
jgi:hypothetical protein